MNKKVMIWFASLSVILIILITVLITVNVTKNTMLKNRGNGYNKVETMTNNFEKQNKGNFNGQNRREFPNQEIETDETIAE